MIRIVKAKYCQVTSFGCRLERSSCLFIYMLQDKFWGSRCTENAAEEQDCDMLPGQNWYGKILMLVAITAMSKSTKTLALTTLNLFGDNATCLFLLS